MTDDPANTPTRRTPGQEGPHALREGQVLLDRYEIRERIGAGGMGEVYSALDRLQQEMIAIKALLPDLAHNTEARERFLSEAKISRRLSHPNIVNVFDGHRDGEFYFLSMKLLEGRNLRAAMQERQQWPVEDGVRIATVVGRALRYAHQYTIHRDIKPENIWIEPDGTIKLMDFGIARILGATRHTQTGYSLGTLDYMAPEQRTGERELDHRVDQYALGVMLYELLCGERPVGRFASVHEKRPDVPAHVSDTIDRALANEPDDRFQNIGEFAQALAHPEAASEQPTGLPSDQYSYTPAFLQQAGKSGEPAPDQAETPTVVVPKKSSSRLWPVLLLLLAIVLGGAWWYTRQQAERPIARGAPGQPKIVTPTAEEPQLPPAPEHETEPKAPPAPWVAEPVREPSAPPPKAVIREFKLAEAKWDVDRERRRAQDVDAATEVPALWNAGERLRAVAADLDQRGDRAEALGRYTRAVETFREAARLAPGIRNANAAQTKARAAATRVDADMHAPEEWQRGEDALAAARAHVQGGAYADATQGFETAAAAYVAAEKTAQPKFTFARELARAQDALKAGKYADALKTLTAAAKTGGDTAEVKALRSQIEEQQKQATYRNAVARATSALAADKPDEALTALAAAERASGVTPEVRQLLARARDLQQQQEQQQQLLSPPGLWWQPTEAQQAYAKQIQQPVFLTNGQGQKLVLVPPGSFQMGSPSSESGRSDDEGPVHAVEITRGFYLGATEVTNAQYRRYKAGHDSKAYSGLSLNGDAQPAVYVSWSDAQAYCRWLTEQERRAGTLSSGWSYRLPTEAEWEYACRAGTRTAYSFGSDGGRLGEYGWYNGNSGSKTHAVGQKRANGWGLYDMHGNVWEWCQSVITSYPYRASDGRESLQGSGRRVLRGGAWNGRPWYCRSASRSYLTPGNSLTLIGFRVVVSSAPGS